MRKRAAILLVGVGLLFCLPAAADLAANVVRVVIKKDSGVALSASAPSGSSDGYSLEASDLGDRMSGYRVAAVSCEFETGGTSVTGGTLKWWKYPGDGGTWGEVTSLRETIQSTGSKWISTPVRVYQDDGRVFCQSSSVTESGAGADGGLKRNYVFRIEGR